MNLTVTGGTLPYKFDWSNGSTSEDLSNLTQGTYTVQITDANGCQFTLSGIVEDQVGLTDISKPSFKVYPNPSVNGIFTIESEIAGKSEMMIKNVQGMIVFIVQLEGGQTKVDLSNLTPGMYIGSIHSMGQHFEIKLIK